MTNYDWSVYDYTPEENADLLVADHGLEKAIARMERAVDSDNRSLARAKSEAMTRLVMRDISYHEETLKVLYAKEVANV